MGVKNLWSLLLPIGRRISIETLSSQTLAIDASIWLTQFLKAMRDPTTGKLYEGAHVLGFVRRLCKLLYHGIKPVLVFDGETPEMKKREVRRRREVRERLVGNYNNNGEDDEGDEVGKRAKRLLIQELKRRKEEEGVKGSSSSSSLGGELKNRKRDAVLKHENENSGGVGGGAFSEGFYLPNDDYDNDDNNKNEYQKEEKGTNINHSSSSSPSLSTTLQPAKDLQGLIHISPSSSQKYDDDDDDYIDLTTNDNHQEEEKEEEEEDITQNDRDNNHSSSSSPPPSPSSPPPKHHTQSIFSTSTSIPSTQQQLSPSTLIIKTLSPTSKSQYISNLQKNQRLQSRSEFMPCAHNSVDFSSCQLRNFLKSCRLNKEVEKLVKGEEDDDIDDDDEKKKEDKGILFYKIKEKKKEEEEEEYKEEDDGLFGKYEKEQQNYYPPPRPNNKQKVYREISWGVVDEQQIITSTTTSYYSPKKHKLKNNNNKMHFFKKKKGRLRKSGLGVRDTSAEDSDDDEDFLFPAAAAITTTDGDADVENGKGGFLKESDDEDEDEDDDDGGGGFVVDSNVTKKNDASTACHNDDADGRGGGGDDDEDDEGGKFIMDSNVHKTNKTSTNSKNNMLYLPDDDDDDDSEAEGEHEDDSGGSGGGSNGNGFLVKPSSYPPPPLLPTKNTKNEQYLNDVMIAKVVQQAEYANDASALFSRGLDSSLSAQNNVININDDDDNEEEVVEEKEEEGGMVSLDEVLARQLQAQEEAGDDGLEEVKEEEEEEEKVVHYRINPSGLNLATFPEKENNDKNDKQEEDDDDGDTDEEDEEEDNDDDIIWEDGDNNNQNDPEKKSTNQTSSIAASTENHKNIKYQNSKGEEIPLHSLELKNITMNGIDKHNDEEYVTKNDNESDEDNDEEDEDEDEDDIDWEDGDDQNESPTFFPPPLTNYKESTTNLKEEKSTASNHNNNKNNNKKIVFDEKNLFPASMFQTQEQCKTNTNNCALDATTATSKIKGDNDEFKDIGKASQVAVAKTAKNNNSDGVNDDVVVLFDNENKKSSTTTNSIEIDYDDDDDDDDDHVDDDENDLIITNDFDSPTKQQQTENSAAAAAALIQAQTTAANLTNWAGRAVRRAIAAHVEETGQDVGKFAASNHYAHSSSDGVVVDSVVEEVVEEISSTASSCDDEDDENTAGRITDAPCEKQVVSGKVETLDNDAKDSANRDQSPNKKESPSAVSQSNHNIALTSNNTNSTTEGTHESKNIIEESSSPFSPSKSSSSSYNFLTNPMDIMDTSLQALKEQEDILAEESRRQQRDMDTVTDEMKADVIQLLQLFGIPYVEAPAEAEAQCVTLEELGLVDGIVTEDSDVFVFGGKSVYKNIFDDQKYVEVYLAKDAERELDLAKNHMVALAMLLGGDYTEGVKGVGIVNGMEILQTFSVEEDVKVGLTKFRKWLDGFDASDALGGGSVDANMEEEKRRENLFLRKHKSARTQWIAPPHFPAQNVLNAYMNPVVDKSRNKFSWGLPDLDNIRKFCSQKIGWTDEETDRVVLPAMKQMESGSRQTRIESYFMKYDDGIKFANVRSKRLRNVLHDVQKKRKQEIQTKQSSEPMATYEEPTKESKTSHHFKASKSDGVSDSKTKDVDSTQELRRKSKRRRVTKRTSK